IDGIDRLADHRSVGLGVVDAGAIAIALTDLAVVREPEAAALVEDDVVRAAQRMAVALRVQHFDLPAVDVDPLDAAAAVVARLVAGHGQAVHLVPFEAAVVADVELAIGPEGRPIGAAASLGDDLNLAVGGDARDGAALDLDEDHAAVGHGNRPFGKLKP